MRFRLVVVVTAVDDAVGYVSDSCRGASHGPDFVEKAGIYVAVNYLGLLDELGVFNRRLTEAEIRELYGQPGVLAPLRKETR